MPPKPQRPAQILRVAASLFIARGYRGTTMDDLASKLGLNKATIYHHFPKGKEQLLFDLLTTALDGVLAELEGVDAELPAEERITAYLRAMVRFQSQHPDAAVVYLQQRPWLKHRVSKPSLALISERESQARSLLQAAVSDGIAAGDFIDVDPALTTVALMSVVTTTAEWSRQRAHPDVDVAVFFSQIAMEGLRARAA